MSCIIYLLTNTIANKIYIGQTWQSLTERWGNGSGYKNSVYVWRAINKYGKKAFKYDILMEVNTQEEADYWEDYYMEMFDSRNPEVGYNIKEGGSNGKMAEETKRKISIANKGRLPPHTGQKRSEETCKKISIAKTGKTFSDEHRKHLSESKKNPSKETRQKISEANKGNKKRLGKTFSEESKRKISEAMKKKGWKIIDGKRTYYQKAS